MAVSTKISKSGLWLLLGVFGLVGAQSAACSSAFHSCYETHTCPPKPHDEAGAAGEESGGAGASGSDRAGAGGVPEEPGAGGTGDAGAPNAAGEGGAGGSDDGPGGSGGSGVVCTTGFLGPHCELPRFASLGASTSAQGISANGKVVVGVLGKAPARWTVETGFQKLQALAEPVDQGAAVGVSADGSVVSGNASLASGVGAFRWNATEGVVLLGTGASSRANAVSSNGAIIVGDMDGPESPSQKHAFRWTVATGVKDLISLGAGAQVNGVNAEGTLLVGGYSGLYDAFLWTNLGATRIGPGTAFAVSADGNTVVGWTNDSGFRYNVTGSGSGAFLLGSLTGTQAKAVSADGKVIVGDSTQGIWIWDATNGVRMLIDVLSSLGANTTGWTSLSIAAGGLSANGLVITGDGYLADAYQGWIARL